MAKTRKFSRIESGSPNRVTGHGRHLRSISWEEVGRPWPPGGESLLDGPRQNEQLRLALVERLLAGEGERREAFPYPKLSKRDFERTKLVVATVAPHLTSRLSAQDEEAFEEHYFSCSRCFELVETHRALQAELKEAASAIRAEQIPWGVSWRWAWAAGAVTVVAVAALALWLRSPVPELAPRAPVAVAPAPASPSFTELARVEPPPYVPVTLRGAADQATQRFRAGMQHYIKGDLGGAVSDLRAAAKLNPRAPEMQFFLGICYLVTGRTDEALTVLQKTIALGESPYLEEAHFYLAKAYLRKGDLATALGELKKTIALAGELEEEAKQLLRQVETLRGGSR